MLELQLRAAPVCRHQLRLRVRGQGQILCHQGGHRQVLYCVTRYCTILFCTVRVVTGRYGAVFEQGGCVSELGGDVKTFCGSSGAGLHRMSNIGDDNQIGVLCCTEDL